ncbi:fructosamine kinase family protein [Muriicola soli]|uniref:Fructosamine kinase n=1 Tax=Muriicola soli TaxID=2507538 RepID=A0A411ED28_9FLAO|nr:fructosamine kinase family protein [Muriicola soli]QBA65360.1 fructosamine kinase [Muriicola soli]
MMSKGLKEHIESLLGLKISSVMSVSGGDISQALKISTSADQFFCKYQAGEEGYAILKAEKVGLAALAGSGKIKTPEVIGLSKTEDGAFLLLEYIESKSKGEKEMIAFGSQLAELHQVMAETYGWETENYIGSLLQKNTRMGGWPGFYTYCRLLPQLELAKRAGLLSEREVPLADRLESRLGEICSASKPSLVHGDLWGGNYLISEDGTPFLIDPSVSYSHPGMDLAMSKLFGGFSASFYEAYQEASRVSFPTPEEIEVYQLYYLLVHLNIFGVSYASSVRSIMKRYF